MYEDTKWYKLAKELYDKKTFEHAKRVAEYAYNNIVVHNYCSIRRTETIYQAALLHDILEDTNLDSEHFINCYHLYGIDYYAYDAVSILTKRDDETYDEYCKRIKYSKNEYAYIVKLADMKDHLNLKETLTPKLKEKYLSGLAELL